MLTSMMVKLVTDDKGQNKPFKPCEYISQIKVEVKIEVIIKVDLDLIMSIEVVQDIINTLEVEQHIVPTIGVVMAITYEVIKDMEDPTITEEEGIEIKTII